MLGLDGGEAADTRSDEGAGGVEVDLREVQTGVLEG